MVRQPDPPKSSLAADLHCSLSSSVRPGNNLRLQAFILCFALYFLVWLWNRPENGGCKSTTAKNERLSSHLLLCAIKKNKTFVSLKNTHPKVVIRLHDVILYFACYFWAWQWRQPEGGTRRDPAVKICCLLLPPSISILLLLCDILEFMLMLQSKLSKNDYIFALPTSEVERMQCFQDE